MSEFDEDLAQAVEDGIARGGLPGAADAVRRGRKRSLRARGGAAVLGVAAIGGALGVGSAFGTGGGAAAASAAGTTATTGHSASVPASSTGAAAAAGHGDGLLAAELWPGYAVEHWVPKLNNPPGKPVHKIATLVMQCGKPQGTPMPAFPVTGMNEWASSYDTAHHVDADQAVFTFADEAGAAAFLADAKAAGSAAPCGSGPAAEVPHPGVSLDQGVSWLVTQQQEPDGLPPSVSHLWVAQAGNRVTLLRVMQFGADYKSTAGDAKVIAELRQALEK